MTILLIPTVEGRDYLDATLASLEGHLQSFNMIVLSVNGLSSAKARTAVTEIKFSSVIKTILLCTNRFLTAIEHLRFITKNLNDLCAPKDLVFLLADDDLLPAGSDLADYIRMVASGDRSCAGIGNFYTFDFSDALPDRQSQHIQPGELMSSLAFLQRNQSGHRFTSMSSMIVPFSILLDVSCFMWRFRSSGRRFEYMIASHKDIATLYSPAICSALIRQHSGQEGRVLSRESMVYDEMVYILWVWLNQPTCRPWNNSTEFKSFSLALFIKITLKFLLLSCRRAIHQAFNRDPATPA